MSNPPPHPAGRGDGPRSVTRGRPLLFALLFLSPLAVRLALFADDRFVPGLADLPGVLSDAAVAWLATAAVLWIGRRRPVPTALLLTGWCGLHYAAYEHVRELDSGLRLTYAGYLLDPTFLFGSALSPSRPLLLTVLIAGTLSTAWWILRRHPPRMPGVAWTITGLAVLALLSWIPLDPDGTSWRHRHFLHANLIETFDRAAGSRHATTAPPVSLGPELGGRPWIDRPSRRENVLLLILEGIPGPFVETVAEAGRVQGEIEMPILSALARRGIAATGFVLHQRQTNRGVYSLLCGDLPRLGTALARMTEYGQTGGPACLPEVLRESGYRTAYIQGSPLGFMMKDRFLERAGFQLVEGENAFDRAAARSRWGVDDRTLLQRALRTMERLELDSKPWFLTLLTVGTHHPYTFPPALRRGSRDDDYAAAVEYLDHAVGELIESMERSGLLHDTLVVITSDESRGLLRARNELTRRISQNWGPLIVLEPSGTRAVLTDPIGQFDVALSIVDYLGLDATETPFLGRSLFRTYGSPRELYFSNTMLERTGAIAADGSLVYCDEPGDRCERFVVDAPSPFGEPRRSVRFEEGDLTYKRQVLAYSLAGDWSRRAVQTYDLTVDREVPISGVPLQHVLGGTNLYVRPGTRIDVSLELEGDGSRGEMRLLHALRTRDQVLFGERLPAIRPGDRVSVHYAYDTSVAIENLKCVLQVLDSHGHGLAVRLVEATVRLSPSPPNHRVLSGLESPPVIRVDRARDS